MSLDYWVPIISAAISFVGLLLVALQIRDSTKQREMESIVELYDINRQLIALGFEHPALLEVLEDKKIPDSLTEKRYLQLWLNQLSLSHGFLRHAVVHTELRDELLRNIVDFFGMTNMQKHWEQYGPFYPDSFQKLVNGILQKNEPPGKAAHPKKPRRHKRQDAKT